MPGVPDVSRVLWVVLALNVAVGVAELIVGFVVGSLAVQANGVHSGVDALNTLVGLVAVRYAAAPPDRDHPYGHGKIETLAAFVVAALIALTAVELGRAAVDRLLAVPAPPAQGLLVPVVMLATLAVNLGVSRWEHRRGTELDSAFLLADAAHTRSDALVTVAVLGSWALGAYGYPQADAIVSLLVVLLILRIGFQVFGRTVPILIDAVRIAPEEIARTVLAVPGVGRCDRLRTRGEGRNAYVELRIHPADARIDGVRAHQLTEEVERRLEARFRVPRDHVTIHVEVVPPELEG